MVNQARTLDIEIGNYRRTMPEGEERTILGSESGILVTNFNTLEVEMEDVYAATPSGLEEAYVRTRTQYYKVMALYNAIKAGE